MVRLLRRRLTLIENSNKLRTQTSVIYFCCEWVIKAKECQEFLLRYLKLILKKKKKKRTFQNYSNIADKLLSQHLINFCIKYYERIK